MALSLHFITAHHYVYTSNDQIGIKYEMIISYRNTWQFGEYKNLMYSRKYRRFDQILSVENFFDFILRDFLSFSNGLYEMK